MARLVCFFPHDADEASNNFLVPTWEITTSMNFLNLTSYDVKISPVDSYNQHSFENGP